jgi:PKD repeat protein
LATASGEGRGFGFDTGSDYALAGQIALVGGGQWPAETAEALTYDVATNTYDTVMPDLNITRRNHAGFFVPGNPGRMYVFGGRSSASGYGGDNPPYAPPEYYEVAGAGPCEPPTAVDFAWNPDNPFAGEPVTFIGTAQGSPPRTYDWDFGDGNTATGNPVQHVYAQPGEYLVTLTVSNDCGTLSVQHTVIMEPCVPPNSTDFDWDPPDPAMGEQVTFSGSAQGSGPPTYAWDFGDGDTATGQVVYHTYQALGTYVVTLTVSNPCGQQIVQHEVVVACDPPHNPGFTWDPPAPFAGDVVTFNGTVQGSEPLAYAWDFGDGNTGSGNPVQHAFAAAGNYAVSMTATNNCGTAQASQWVHVEPAITGYLHLNRAKMNWNPSTVRAGYFRVIWLGRIKDQTHALVPGATVWGNFTYPDGSVHPMHGVTDYRGQVRFRIHSVLAGEYTFCVTDMSALAYGYDPAANQWPECMSIEAGPR